MNIPFLELRRDYLELQEEMDAAVRQSLSEGHYILGHKVEAFEQAFARYCGRRHAAGVASGTDALYLSLRAAGIGRGHEVITTPLSAFATAAAILQSGAKPVFADVEEETLTIDPDAAASKVNERTRAIVPVHLYGCPANLAGLRRLTEAHGLYLIEDACQAHGSRYHGCLAGSIGHTGCFSFYPTKNLGAVGDGGMIVTDDDDLAARVRWLRNYGERERHCSELPGVNSRLDEIQAAVLLVKLKYLDSRNERRRALAQEYSARVKNPLWELPEIPPDRESNFHLFVVRTDHRASLQSFLAGKGIETALHYPRLIYEHPVWTSRGVQERCPVAERQVRRILSLPLYPQLRQDEIDHICAALQAFRP